MLKINNFYSIILGLVAIASLGGCVWMVYYLDPSAGITNIILFYTAVGIFVTSITALIIYLFKQRFGVREQVKKHLTTSLRQGSWMGLIILIGLYLQSQDLWTWWHSIFLFAAFFFLESYFIHADRKISN